jgi:putative acetyltransferase
VRIAYPLAIIAFVENVDPGSPDAQRLTAALDREIMRRYPGEPVNGIDLDEFRAANGYFVVVREPDSRQPVGCGAFRPVTPDCAEIKRMFVEEPFRGRGYAKQILTHLETVGKQRGFRGFVLETGIGQPEAMGLYERLGYFRIPKYGRHVGSEKSVCYAKQG